MKSIIFYFKNLFLILKLVFLKEKLKKFRKNPKIAKWMPKCLIRIIDKMEEEDNEIANKK